MFRSRVRSRVPGLRSLIDCRAQTRAPRRIAALTSSDIHPRNRWPMFTRLGLRLCHSPADKQTWTHGPADNYKEENWNHEVKIQDLQNQLSEAESNTQRAKTEMKSQIWKCCRG